MKNLWNQMNFGVLSNFENLENCFEIDSRVIDNPRLRITLPLLTMTKQLVEERPLNRQTLDPIFLFFFSNRGVLVR